MARAWWLSLALVGGALGCDAAIGMTLGDSTAVAPVEPRGAKPVERRTVTPPARALSFSDAKRELRKVYDEGEAFDLYGGCAFSGWKIDWRRCCLSSDGLSRAGLEWEHVVPAATFGGKLDAWRKGHPSCKKRGKPFKGRNCARKVSKRFQAMEGDMHNLYPTIGHLNAARSNRAMTLIDGEERAFGSCDFEIAKDAVEPRPEVRGDVARAYLYMDSAYPDARILDDEGRRFFDAWHRADPPDALERRRNRFIAAAQGNPNPWIDPNPSID